MKPAARPAAIPGEGGEYRMGLRLAALSLAVGMAAVNTGNNLLYLMLSLVLGLAAVSLGAARWSLRRLRVEPLLPEEATRGEPFLLGAEVTGRFPLLPQTWVRVRLDGLPGTVELPVVVIGGAGAAGAAGRGVASRRVTVDRRGVYEDLSVVALTGYPLDLSLGRARQPWRGRLIVLPRFEPIARLRVARRAEPRHDGSHDAAAEPSRRAAGAGTELRDIREYSVDDDARHIDWRSTARTGRPMVRRFERERERRLDLVLDPRCADAEAFERAVERCAAILDLARRAPFDARLLVPGAGAPVAGREAMRRLAGVRRVEQPGESARTALRETLAQARRDAEVIVISAEPALATPIEVA